MRLKDWRCGLLLLVLGSLALGSAPGARGDDDDDPPGRVARLNYMKGTISLRPGTVDDWTEASTNYPLTTGDHLWADRDSRGEIHIGGSIVRLGSETAFSFLNLDDRTAQMRITGGSASVRVNHLEEDEVVEVDTPNAAVSLLKEGLYRIDVGQDGEETTVSVRHGEAEVTAGGSAFSVRRQESAYISGTDSPTYDIRDARRNDEWEDWCEERDQREERSSSSRYVSRDMVGYSDLDDNGTWRDDREYGAVWIPTHVSREWAPYREGRWSWVYPWGWTWVDDSSWGFAPFHYGRWANIQGVWGWCPGTIVARPVYAPALVVFVGGGSWSSSLSITDGVGWFALGPREVYVPPYRHSNRYVQNVNVTQVNVTNINVTNINVTNVNYANRNVRGAVTAVPRNEFVGGRSLARSAVVVSSAAIRSAPVGGSVQVVAQIQPRRESVVGDRRVTMAKPPARAIERPVVARLTPPAPPVHFGEQAPRKTEAPRSNPLVKTALPKNDTITLRPARTGLQKAQPVSPHETDVRRRTTTEPTATERPDAGRPKDPGDRPTGNKNERSTDRPTDRPTPKPRSDENRPNDRPTPRPTPTPRAEREDRVRPTPRPEPEDRPTTKPRPTPTPRAEREDRVRPTPRPEPEDRPTPKPRPTPTPRAEREDRVRPTPRPEPEDRPTPKPRPTPTPRAEREERVRPTPRPEPEERPTPRPTPTPRAEREERPRPTPTPRPEPKPTPKPTPTPSPTPKPK